MSAELERQLQSARDIAVALEQRLAAVEALCDQWERCLGEPWRRPGYSGGAILADFRAALDPEPTDA